MPETPSLTTPLEIDTHLAELHTELSLLKAKSASAVNTIMERSGSRRHYQGRLLVWDLSFEQAAEKVREQATRDDYQGQRAESALQKFHEARGAAGIKADEVAKVSALYTGWSRFFVVTSSQGHIHSSMACSSCYPTTTYGWLPQLSGKDEADAVETCGPALCSVCFPSAPVEEQGAKISQDDAKQLAAGKTMAELQAERDAVKQAKADAKAEKARKAAERARKLMDKVEAFYEAHGGYDAVMALELYAPTGSLSELTNQLQTTVQDTIMDDHREFHGLRRYGKNPRGLLEVA